MFTNLKLGAWWVFVGIALGSFSAQATLPHHLSETGLFKELITLTPQDDLLSYEVNSPLWSDGAKKWRWMRLPPQGKVQFNQNGPWNFPKATVFIKHFEIDSGEEKSRRLETRVLIHEEQGWVGYTYKWNQAQTDADLMEDLLDPVSDRLVHRDGTRQRWIYPTRQQCLTCHNNESGNVLGANTLQLAGANSANLSEWNNLGIFENQIGDPHRFDSYVNPMDTSAGLAERSRSYLSANCMHCHNPQVRADHFIDLRFGIPIGNLGIINVRPLDGDLGLPEGRRIVPGNKTQSVLWQRINTVQPERMPLLGSRVIDTAAVDLIGQWIDAGCPDTVQDRTSVH